MSLEPVSQLSGTLRQVVVCYRWIYALGLLIVIAALVTNRLTSVPAPALAVDHAQASFVAFAAQNVMEYLRTHRIIPLLPTPEVPLDPAQQSVLNYLRAHERVEQSRAPWYPAVQAVLGYLRAHSR